MSGKFAEILNFTKEHGVVSLENQNAHVVIERLNKLSDALTEAQLATLNAKADYEATQALAEEPSRLKQFAAASPSAGIRVFVKDTETELRGELRAAEPIRGTEQ